MATPLQTALVSVLLEAEKLETMKGKRKEYSEISDYILSRVCSTLGGFSLICISNFKTSADKKHVISMMNVYQSVLDSLGLSTPRINEICRNFQRIGEIGAKLTGSGAGGDVIVFSDTPHKIAEIERVSRANDYIVHFKSWEEKKKYDPIQKFDKYIVLKHSLGEKTKDVAYIGVVAKKLPESPEYCTKGVFSRETIEAQRKVVDDVRRMIEFANKCKIKLDVIVLPEYSLPPEEDEHHLLVREELRKISKEEDLIIVAGSYLSRSYEDICLVFAPKLDEPFEVLKLNRSPKMDPETLKEGHIIHIFENSRIGDFCVLVCYDALSEEIPRRIRSRSRRGESLTLFVISCTSAIHEFKKTCEVLSLPSWKSMEDFNSDRGVTANVILADGYHGESYYAAPVREGSPVPKETVSKAKKQESDLYIYEVLVEEMSKARGSGVTHIFYAIGAD